MIPVFQWIGYIAAALAGLALVQGHVSAWWLPAWAAGHVLGGIAISVGLHRYFTHGAFKTTPFWHAFLALISCLVVQGSPLAWSCAHQTHHTHADTKRDTHKVGLSYVLWKTYNDVPLERWRLKALVSDPWCHFVHTYTLAVIAAWCALLMFAGWATGTGWLPLVYGYLAPLGTVQVVGAAHQVISHRFDGARDMPLLEWLFPAAGEWNHGYHHHFPREARLGDRWWHLDYGWLFIRCIRSR